MVRRLFNHDFDLGSIEPNIAPIKDQNRQDGSAVMTRKDIAKVSSPGGSIPVDSALSNKNPGRSTENSATPISRAPGESSVRSPRA